ncbi:MAG: hypothetical protein IPL09_10625 [Bacteroidetes bacterium]|nr:hypothetical protein [Bacteroidota bacterium]
MGVIRGRVKYKFKEINAERIEIVRLDGGNNAIIGRFGASRAIAKLKRVGKIKKKDLINGVVRQTTLTFLHPNIVYDKVSKQIIWQENSLQLNDIEQIIKDADDDIYKRFKMG